MCCVVDNFFLPLSLLFSAFACFCSLLFFVIMNVVRYNCLLSLWRPGSIVSGKEVVSSFSPADSYLIDVPIVV